VTVMESVDRYVPFADSSTGRLLWTQLHRDDEGNPELFVLVCAVKSAPPYKGSPEGARTPHQGRRTKPFLRTWQGAMNHWASGNCDVLKDSVSSRSHEFGRRPTLRPTSVCILVTPGSPARPEASTPVLQTLEPFFDHRRPPIAALRTGSREALRS
jgi:hypothetical protein